MRLFYFKANVVINVFDFYKYKRVIVERIQRLIFTFGSFQALQWLASEVRFEQNILNGKLEIIPCYLLSDVENVKLTRSFEIRTSHSF